MGSLIISGAEIVESGMAPDTIVEGFHVEEQVHLGFGSGAIEAMMHAFGFQGAEEAIDGRIVVAVAGAAHAYQHLVVL